MAGKVCNKCINNIIILMTITEVFKLDFNVIDIGLCGIAVVIGIIYFITKVTADIFVVLIDAHFVALDT